ncbi:unnamed protein product [Arctia plantaginis]|uniref:C2H2-type domain-containing protein n=1 Tax=Arctia plantaginis TaxID=874455 RepID=A0A8S1B953_ARCPL|nr:unnamed protein product [Arctia plantaginis]
MSSFLCFICHNAVNADTTEETREKYREVVTMNLCPDSQLCYICCHMVNKLWVFKSICIKRSHEYPVLFSEKSSINLHRSDIETLILCPEETCLTNSATQLYFRYTDDNKDQSNDYVKFDDENNDFDEYIPQDTAEDCSAAIEPYNEESVSTEPSRTQLKLEFDGSEAVNDFKGYGYINTGIGSFEDAEFNDADFKTEENNENNEDVDHESITNNLNGEIVEETDNPKHNITSNNIVEDYKKTLLSVEEQKGELEGQRRSKKYLDAEFKCYNCALGFLFKDSYQAHMMRHEESNGEYVCLLCTLRFASTAVLRAHRAVHRERYVCSHCGVKVRKRQRDTHARKCHKKEDDSAACHLCGNVFQNASCLQQHLKRFHMSRTSNRTYSCNVCGKSYENQAAVRTHMIKHIQRKFTCDVCSANFSSPYTLTQHKKKHSITSTDKPHVCVTCGVGYTTRKSLLAHMRTALQHQERVYDCPICSRICPNPSALSSHISRVHSANKNFSCNLCGYKYTSRKSLLRHVREHTSRAKVKEVQCHLCGKSFKGNSKLNRHLREVCGKDKLEEELSAYHEQHNSIL